MPFFVDQELGELAFQENELGKSYSCKVPFAGFTRQVEVFFETDSIENLPSEQQRKFLMLLTTNLDNILSTIVAQISNKLQYPEIALVNVEEIYHSYNLHTIGIPKDLQEPAKWDLSLTNKSNGNIHILADFTGMTLSLLCVENSEGRPFILKIFEKLFKW